MNQMLVLKTVGVAVDLDQLEKVNKGRRNQGNQTIDPETHVEQLIAGALNAPICTGVVVRKAVSPYHLRLALARAIYTLENEEKKEGFTGPSAILSVWRDMFQEMGGSEHP